MCSSLDRLIEHGPVLAQARAGVIASQFVVMGKLQRLQADRSCPTALRNQLYMFSPFLRLRKVRALEHLTRLAP